MNAVQSSGKNTANEPQVLIERMFNAPRERVFDAWSDPRHLSQWYAPRGCDIQFKQLDFRPGGEFLSCISSPQFSCWCKGVYLEIVRPERIVFTMRVCDEQGNNLDSVAAGHDSEWPEETTTTIALAEVQGKTRLTLQQTVSEALAKKTGAHPSWLQMLDRLAELLAGK